ncbi:MAG: hypothetical protein SNJ54_07910 [Anaerolineae bacterium]
MRAVWVLIGLVIVGYVQAQEVSLSADGPVRVPLMIPENARLTITALGVDEIDTVLTLLDEAQRVVAYSDDRMVDGALVRDAQIVYDRPGDYLLLVDSFNGVSEGRVQLVIEQAPLVPALRVGEALTLTLERWRPLRLRLRLEDPTTLQLSATSAGRRLDLLAWVMIDGGSLLADDDQGRFDLQAVWQLPAGDHELWVIDWLGRAGEVQVTAQAAE